MKGIFFYYFTFLLMRWLSNLMVCLLLLCFLLILWQVFICWLIILFLLEKLRCSVTFFNFLFPGALHFLMHRIFFSVHNMCVSLCILLFLFGSSFGLFFFFSFCLHIVCLGVTLIPLSSIFSWVQRRLIYEGEKKETSNIELRHTSKAYRQLAFEYQAHWKSINCFIFLLSLSY